MTTLSEQNPDRQPVYESNFEATYTLELVAQITGVSSQTILLYHERGLVPVSDTASAGKPHFGDDAVRAIRRMEHLRTEWQLSERALELTLNLLTEIERLQQETRARK